MRCWDGVAWHGMTPYSKPYSKPYRSYWTTLRNLWIVNDCDLARWKITMWFKMWFKMSRRPIICDPLCCVAPDDFSTPKTHPYAALRGARHLKGWQAQHNMVKSWEVILSPQISNLCPLCTRCITWPDLFSTCLNLLSAQLLWCCWSMFELCVCVCEPSE